SVRLAADIRDNEGRVFARQGEVMNPLQYVPFNQTLYFINGDDPVILVSPAVVQGAPDITREIQQDIARRMRAEP
ncbi:TrbI F-type domain-containing protein, partial [Escherichia coli]|uniref:TrbI F-type domain-containing protein n=1 Tax=Escherichia coli TaxID=562 RepID=UPI001676950F